MPRILVFLFILSNPLCFYIPLAARPQTEVSIVDFKPREGWNIKGPLSVQPDGRMTLIQDGLGVAWKSVELNVDEFPMMLAVVTNTLPRERWVIAVEKGKSSAEGEAWIKDFGDRAIVMNSRIGKAIIGNCLHKK